MMLRRSFQGSGQAQRLLMGLSSDKKQSGIENLRCDTYICVPLPSPAWTVFRLRAPVTSILATRTRSDRACLVLGDTLMVLVGRWSIDHWDIELESRCLSIGSLRRDLATTYAQLSLASSRRPVLQAWPRTATPYSRLIETRAARTATFRTPETRHQSPTVYRLRLCFQSVRQMHQS
jgi:hypothetical protein